jgi:hypothetical protein
LQVRNRGENGKKFRLPRKIIFDPLGKPGVLRLDKRKNKDYNESSGREKNPPRPQNRKNKMARNSKMTARKNISRKIANPVTQLWDGAQSKSAVLFDMLKTKNGAHVEDLVQATGWNVATVRVRLNQIGKLGYTVANVGGYGDSVYKLVA